MPMSQEHKRKISEGLKRYHRTCGGGKNKKMIKKQLDEERKKLKRLITKK